MNIKNILAVLVCSSVSIATFAATHTYTTEHFATPPIQWRPIPLWFWNNTIIKEQEIKQQIEQMINTDFYGGCAILPFGSSFRPGYLSEEYFNLYQKAIDMADKYGASMSLYDEYGFPSGSMGAINGSGVTTFKNNHPEYTIKRLDKQEFKTLNGKRYSMKLASETNIMAIVAMDRNTHKIISLRKNIKDNLLQWDVPKNGKWTIMLFTCVTDGDPNVDYLCPKAVQMFVNDTHQNYYNRFPAAFGKTIKSTFFDEPTMYRANGRMWTPDFNEKFEAAYGFSPETLYPALWYDIGENTASARNMMFGMRARLYSEGFMKTIGEWAKNHGIHSTGHQDQEEITNPVSVAGDLMLAGKYISMPGIDKIGGNRPAEHFYKIVSSSAYNWDKTFVMSETYGDMGNIPFETMYNIATEQYTKGINNLIPHAVWYDTSNVTFRPELSWRNPLYKFALPDFNRFLARLNYILAREGRHVADVAMLYPITTLQAGHYLDGPKGFMQGGVDIPGTDYNVVSRVLTDELGIDFTYLHPEVIDERCTIKGNRMVMNNKINHESYSIIIIPGTKVITSSNMRKILKAWEAGATIVFTTCLPERCADMNGNNARIKKDVARMLAGKKGCGQAVFIETPNARNLATVFKHEKLDVEFITTDHPFNYIHKIIDGHDVYYFGNIDSTTSTCTVKMRGKLSACSFLNPRTGTVSKALLSYDNNYTTTNITLTPGNSVFLVDNELIDLSNTPEYSETKGYTLELDFKIDRLSAGICFGGIDTHNYYMWQLNIEDPSNPMFRPHRWFDGHPSVLEEVSMAGKVNIGKSGIHHLKIVVTNDTHAVTFIDNILIDERYGQFPLAMFGFRETHSDNAEDIEAAYFGNIRLTTIPDNNVIFHEDFTSGNRFDRSTVSDGMLYVKGDMNNDNYVWNTPGNIIIPE